MFLVHPQVQQEKEDHLECPVHLEIVDYLAHEDHKVHLATVNNVTIHPLNLLTRWPSPCSINNNKQKVHQTAPVTLTLQTLNEWLFFGKLVHILHQVNVQLRKEKKEVILIYF